ncbi:MULTISPECIES: Mur ligase family protein [unclassified Rhizobium]|jgi:dihydrofolate synthase/folylpolyglutamate synthase|uniref:bifunctional folylpolyglutamate synthase/dihydrofolate synthase n=1 Tax=unclassified Rhizobium TaxID=2613769 RepID=UPI000646DCF9|nr:MULTISPECIES: Mur ligase family protein [unclassified Rhizobium]MBN8951527.1 bifunctional folylpolyglutamate synthase/dihydrofolate synthase [Rhizobium tropici]OJY67736.1 MAG: bifunctional folylpolyglutamate synthase/dihydrofolate synthase [Rhizobium sp. 60-20]RKD60211.1 dihydrofolate synthase/folylpolyglutamate synthase [Rhizobium sp. WW_1]
MSQSHPSPALSDALHRLDQLTNWERKPRGEMRVGLEPMLDLMQRLGNPHRSFRAIHVAGTKGKGSVAALLEAGLVRAGRQVGRYASPHVDRVNERVSLLGQEVGDDALAGAIMQVLDGYESAKRAATAGEDATWFDVITAAAFVVFRDAGLNWVVVEVGLGGRLDSTNVVFGEVAIVTNIGLEHTEILGSTREAIAGEKVGILKPGATLATTLAADDAAGRVLQQRADELGCDVLRTDLPEDATIAETNMALVGMVFDHLGRGGESVNDGGAKSRPVGAWLLEPGVVDRARLPGRMERFDFALPPKLQGGRQTVPIIMDGAHVPFNIEAVLRDITHSSSVNGDCVAVVALASDKDAPGFLSVLSRYVAYAIFTEASGSGRAHAAKDLQALAVSAGMACEAEPDPHLALDRAAVKAAERSGWILVTGSLYLVGALRATVMSRAL